MLDMFCGAGLLGRGVSEMKRCWMGGDTVEARFLYGKAQGEVVVEGGAG